MMPNAVLSGTWNRPSGKLQLYKTLRKLKDHIFKDISAFNMLNTIEF